MISEHCMDPHDLQVLQKLNKEGKVYTKALFYTVVVFLKKYA
jgi:hypothetical protein